MNQNLSEGKNVSCLAIAKSQSENFFILFWSHITVDSSVWLVSKKASRKNEIFKAFVSVIFIVAACKNIFVFDSQATDTCQGYTTVI